MNGTARIVALVGLGSTACPAFASDFAALMVFIVVIVVAVILAVQALIGIALVIDGRYRSRDPGVFVVIAVVLLLVGSGALLSESDHLADADLLFGFGILFGPGAVAIIPPLVQRMRAREGGDGAQN